MGGSNGACTQVKHDTHNTIAFIAIHSKDSAKLLPKAQV